MIQEQKQLLLIDLCARLPYGVEIWYEHSPIPLTLSPHILDGLWNESAEYKPYLRPLSSMTEEESKEFDVITNGERGFYEDENGWIRCDNIHTKWGVWPKGCSEMLDWLNKRHFDYRGLIEKGLALEAPEGMYKTE